MDKTQQHRIVLKFIEEMGIDNDHHTATLIDLIAGHSKSDDPAADLRKASFYLLRLIEKHEQEFYNKDFDEEYDRETDPSVSPTGTKVLRIYDKLY